MFYRTIFFVLISALINACGSGGSDGDPNVPPPPSTPLVNPLNVLSLTDSVKYDYTGIIFPVLSPDEKHMYAYASHGKSFEKRLIHFTLDETSGTYLFTNELLVGPDFEYISSVAISPDGSQLYISHGLGTSNYSRDIITGDLTYSGIFTNFMLPDGPATFRGMIVTHEGNYLYGFRDGKVVIFSLDGQTGDFIYIGQQNFTSAFLEKIIVSPDDKYLYLFSHEEIIVTEINKSTGYLTQIQNFGGDLIPTGEFAQFELASDISINSSGTEIYIYGAIRSREVSSGWVYTNDGLLIADRDVQTGTLTYKQMVPINDIRYTVAIGDTSSIAVVGDYVYVQKREKIDKKSPNAILYTFSRTNANNFELASSNIIGESVGAPGNQTIDNLISTQSDLIYTYAGKSIHLFVDPIDGSIQQSTKLSTDNDEVEELGNASYVITSPDGNNLYAMSQLAITVFNFDSTTGENQHVQTIYAGSSDFFPDVPGVLFGAPRSDLKGTIKAMDVSPDGKFLYIISTSLGGNRIIALSRDAGTGVLSRLSSPSMGVFDFNILDDYISSQPTEVPIFYDAGEVGFGRFNLESITISPDGLHIYVAGFVRNNNAAVGVLARDEINGELSLIELIDTASGGNYGGWKPRIINISPDGKNIYFSNYQDGALFNFSRDQTTGRLSILEVFQGIELIDVTNIVFGTNGKYVYVSADGIALSPASFDGVFPNTVSMLVFERDQVTGELTLVQLLEKNGEDANGNILNSDIIQGGIRHSAISSDGTELYALTQRQRTIYETKVDNGKRLDVYLINPNDGSLSLVQKLDDGQAGYGISSVAASLDGNHVFVTNERYNSISVLERK